MSTYRFSWARSNGWGRLGAVGAVIVLFSTPMLWALGSFGAGDDMFKRALTFLFAGMWLCVAAGYAMGWALRGFMIRIKDHEDEDEGGSVHRAAAPPHAAHPPAAGAHRPGH